MIKVKDYIPIVEFLGKALDSHCEIVLHDLSNPESSIIAIVNGTLSGRKIGSPVTNLVLKVLKNGEADRNLFYTNYHSKNINGHICRSSTFFIHNETGKTIGLLCINRDISPFIEARNFITDNLIGEVLNSSDKNTNTGGNSNDSNNMSVFENFQGTANEVIDTMIFNTLAKYSIAPERLSLDERMAVAKSLNESGLFLLKGGVTALADKLKVSEPTIYRYLSKLKK